MKLKAVRLMKDLRQYELSNLSGISQPRISLIEKERVKASEDEKQKLAQALGASVEQIFPNEGGSNMRIEVGPPKQERYQAAFDKLLGLDVGEKFRDDPPFRSLRTAYHAIQGDPEMTGIPSRETEELRLGFMQMMRLPAAYSSASFSFVAGNSMYRRLIKEYRAVEYREDILFSYFRNAENFKTLEIIQVGYFGDAPDVNPETLDYTEVNLPTDIEASYALNQKGQILTINRKALLNDDLKSIVQLVSKLGRAYRRTHAKRAWNKIIDNADFGGDATPLFHIDHGNLGAVTLTNDATGIATLTAALKAMYAQTERDSGEGLGLQALYLWCPRELLENAQALNSTWVVTANNPHAGRFGKNHERIIYNPLFTDTNDWGLVANAQDVELLEAAYLNGGREPEFFLADNPLVAQMFVADKIQYKIRHEYEFEIADYPGFWKAVVG
jgi:transcriptional regulator with XRE-family HTH domain